MKDLLRPGYYFCKDSIDFKGRKRLKKNSALNDLYLGERAFLLLTGASLQHIDIRKLQDEYTFGTGFIFLHEDIGKIDPTFYIDLEPSKGFKPSNPNWPKSHLGPLEHEGVVSFYREIDSRFADKTALILHSDNYKFIAKHNLFKNKTTYCVKGQKRLHVPRAVPYGVIADLTRRSISGGGAIFFSILIMMYMGFKDIYLCGAGYTYEPIYELHFYDTPMFPETIGRGRAEIEARKAVTERNERMGSSLEYHGVQETRYGYMGICVRRVSYDANKDKHRILNDYARSQGVGIHNIVPEGFVSPIYEKISWEEVERNILASQPG